MITEHGTIKVNTEMNGKVQKEFMQGNFRLGLAFTIIGSVGAVIYLIMQIIEIIMDLDAGLFMFLVVSALFLGMGLFLMISFNKSVKTADELKKTYTFEFFKDYFVTSEILNGETVANAKIYNSQIVRSRETQSYLFFYTNSVAACPIAKQELSEEELNTLRAVFRLPVKGNTLNLSTEPTVQVIEENETAEAEVKSNEPFDEF